MTDAFSQITAQILVSQFERGSRALIGLTVNGATSDQWHAHVLCALTIHTCLLFKHVSAFLASRAYGGKYRAPSVSTQFEVVFSL